MRGNSFAAHERLLRLAHDFVLETRRDLAHAVADGSDLPPRVRVVHERPGHPSPEFRTLAVPLDEDAAGASPTVLSDAIAAYAARARPSCLLFAADVIGSDENGDPMPLLIAEARDRSGVRLFMVQPFRVQDGRITWNEPLEGGWRDPGSEEMILDAAFR